MTATKNTLLIANFDSGVGYAWTLIEDFWIAIHHENLKVKRESIICYPSISTIAQKIVDAKIETKIHDFNNKSLLQIPKNIYFILKNRIDVLYITDQKKRSYKYGLYRLFGVKKIIVHDHSPGLRADQNALTSKIKRYFSNILPSFRCTAAFAVSPYITKRLQEVNALPANTIYEITNGIQIRERFPHKQTSDTVNIVSVARLTTYKAIDFSLKTLAEVKRRTPNVKLHYYVIGDGPELNNLKDLSQELAITESVTFMGKQDHNSVIERLQNCDIAFHPSKGEAMSLAILEYMQSELALITSNNPSVCSAFQADKEGITYRENDVIDAADKLSALIENQELRAKLGKAAREKVITHFSDSLMMKKFIAAYSEVIAA